jgi:hypothetical protein
MALASFVIGESLVRLADRLGTDFARCFLACNRDSYHSI